MQKFDDTHSFLMVYAPNGDLIEYVVNTHATNKKYQETFEDIKQASLKDDKEYPFEMMLADSQLKHLAVRLSGEMLEKLVLKEYDYALAQHHHPEVFQPDDIS